LRLRPLSFESTRAAREGGSSRASSAARAAASIVAGPLAPGQDQNGLAPALLRIVLTEGVQFVQATAPDGFMAFGQLARNGGGSIGTQNRNAVGQNLDQVAGRNVADDRGRHGCQRLQPTPPCGRAGRQKAFEPESIRRQAGGRQRRDRRARAGNRADRQTRGVGGADQAVAGIGNQRRPGIADQGHVNAGPEQAEHLLDHPLLAVFIEPDPAWARPTPGEQAPADPGIFRGNHRNRFQQIAGPLGQIAKMPDRGGDDPEGGLTLPGGLAHICIVGQTVPASRVL